MKAQVSKHVYTILKNANRKESSKLTIPLMEKSIIIKCDNETYKISTQFPIKMLIKGD
jgi:hypothetical protein